ncbi:MAG TPA: hypothetical protein VNF68_04010 [Candidatus Baltobacteraceae bacterium]|nr:hypothetical protein [Candidatus Baltobacteraceae bacterium]
MMFDSPPPTPRPPHPLALALLELVGARFGARVLEVGAGSGRNTRVLTGAGLEVVGLESGLEAVAALATHALLHGTPQSIASALDSIARLLQPGAPFFGTFGSVRDARYGTGVEIEPHVYAPATGDEAGVAHTYFDEPRLRAMMAADWEIESLREVAVDAIAGTWAHPQTPLRGAVHWFLIATKRR